MSWTVAGILIGRFRVNDQILQTSDVKEDERGPVEKRDFRGIWVIRQFCRGIMKPSGFCPCVYVNGSSCWNISRRPPAQPIPLKVALRFALNGAECKRVPRSVRLL